jgi:predicted phage-related endonuclease
VNPAEDFIPSEAARWGILMESVIAAEWARRNRVELRQGELLRDPLRAYVLGTPDYLTLENPARLIEVKTVGSWAYRNDWDEGGRVPGYYQCQVQWYLHLTGLDRAVVVALVGGSRLETFDLKRDQGAIVALLDAADEFWNGHVATGQPPEPDGRDRTRKAIEATYVAPERATRTILPEEAREAIREYVAARDQIREYYNRRDAAANALRQWLGDAGADEGSLPGDADAAVTWKATKVLDVDALAKTLTPDQLARYGKLTIDVNELEREIGRKAVEQFRHRGESRRLTVKVGDSAY